MGVNLRVRVCSRREMCCGRTRVIFLSRLRRPRICSSFRALNGGDCSSKLHESTEGVAERPAIAALNNVCWKEGIGRKEGEGRKTIKNRPAPVCKIGQPLVARLQTARRECLLWTAYTQIYHLVILFKSVCLETCQKNVLITSGSRYVFICIRLFLIMNKTQQSIC